jgi:hypothetical protein
VIWIDYDFDYGDPLAEKYMKFRGKYYDVGTIAKIKGCNGPIIVRFLGWHFRNDRNNFEVVDACGSWLYNTYNRSGVMDYCLEIIKPVYPKLQTSQINTIKNDVSEREKPPSWDVEVAWIWYIAIMLVTVIFKDRIGLWILESVVFFGWKEGIFKGGKK